MLRTQGIRMALLATLCWVGQAAALEMREGDIIFHPSRSTQSLAIQQATHSRYSHMGLVLYRDGQLQVFEANARVKYTPLAEWIARGEGGHYVLKRLREADRLLDEPALHRLRAEAAPFAGRRYDLTFEWSDQRIYCSELVWKIYQRALGLEIGALQQIRDFDLSSVAVRSKMHERYGEQVPLDEQVISPAAMFDSPLLVQVYAQ